MGDNMEELSDGDMNQTSAKEPAIPISQFLQQNYENLPRFEKFFFEYAASFVGANSGVCGLMAQNLFRRALKIRKPYLLSTLMVTTIPFASTNIYHYLLVTQPLLEGSLNCPTCAVVKGLYVGVVMGGAAPIVLAGFTSLMTVPQALRTPMKESILREIISFTKPVFIRLKHFLLFEAVASLLITNRQITTIEKLLRMSPVSQTQEELGE